MRITVQAVIESGDGTADRIVPISLLERTADHAPSSGLGMLLREGNKVLQSLQTVFVEEQVRGFAALVGRCRSCDVPLAHKDSRSIVYRTAYGKLRLTSPRLIARCSACGFADDGRSTISPVAQALPERTHPQWAWLQCRYAGVMSYRLARIFLRHTFPGGECLPESSVKATVRAIGDRLESDAQAATTKAWKALLPYRHSPEGESGFAIQIDAGYIKAVPREDGSRSFGAVASKLSVPGVTRTHVHAYVGNSDPMQGARQRAFMQSVGIGLRAPVTVLTDGGNDVNEASRLPTGADRLLDWFHIGMRFEHLRLAVAGLRSFDDQSRAQLQRQVDGAKWLLWHGKKERCLERLQSLRRETGWAGARNALGRLITYLQSCWNILADYASRRARRLPISTAGAESAVDSVIGQRLKRNGHMRWTRSGANAVLQVRCAALNGQDVRHFKRWYPPDSKFVNAPAAA